MGAVLSFGEDARWRRFLVSRVNAMPGSRVLDVAAGTGLVSIELAARRNVLVTAIDLSPRMLLHGRRSIRGAGLEDRISIVNGRAEQLPFADATFDSVTFTYLLRYVDDPQATLAEMARVLRPGGVLAGLEFHVPPNAVARGAWLAYTRIAMPAIGVVVSPGWGRAGRFLGPSISRFWQRYPLERQLEMWAAAGLRLVRHRAMSLGGGIVIWGVKEGSPRG
jgi:demethylmenaquinone methyltransferase/2-methoxy-6-polyprenyl-1,4-benzoquinol methylase